MRCQSWGMYDSHYYTYFTLCCISPLDPPLIQLFAHCARRCFYTQVSHIKAEGWLCLSRWVGGNGGAGVDTGGAYLSTQISPSRLRPRRLTQHVGTWTNIADATTPCLHA